MAVKQVYLLHTYLSKTPFPLHGYFVDKFLVRVIEALQQFEKTLPDQGRMPVNAKIGEATIALNTEHTVIHAIITVSSELSLEGLDLAFFKAVLVAHLNDCNIPWGDIHNQEFLVFNSEGILGEVLFVPMPERWHSLY